MTAPSLLAGYRSSTKQCERLASSSDCVRLATMVPVEDAPPVRVEGASVIVYVAGGGTTVMVAVRITGPRRAVIVTLIGKVTRSVVNRKLPVVSVGLTVTLDGIFTTVGLLLD